jgi:hypothetical protein
MVVRRGLVQNSFSDNIIDMHIGQIHFNTISLVTIAD